MAVDEELADRVRAAVAAREVRWDERRMFGALVLMVEGEILAGVRVGELLVRCAAEESEELQRRGARVAEMGGRSMGPSWLHVGPDGLDDDAELASWVDAALRRPRT